MNEPKRNRGKEEASPPQSLKKIKEDTTECIFHNEFLQDEDLQERFPICSFLTCDEKKDIHVKPILENEEFLPSLIEIEDVFQGSITKRDVTLKDVKEESKYLIDWFKFGECEEYGDFMKSCKVQFVKYISYLWEKFEKLEEQTKLSKNNTIPVEWDSSFISTGSDCNELSFLSVTPMTPYSDSTIESPKQTPISKVKEEPYFDDFGSAVKVMNSNSISSLIGTSKTDEVDSNISRRVLNIVDRFQRIMHMEFTPVRKMLKYLKSEEFVNRFPVLNGCIESDNQYTYLVFRSEEELSSFRLSAFKRIFQYFGVKLFFNSKPSSIVTNTRPDIFSEGNVRVITELKVKDVIRRSNYKDLRNMFLIPEEMSIYTTHTNYLTLMGGSDFFHVFIQKNQFLYLHSIDFHSEMGLLNLLAVTLCFLEEQTKILFKDIQEQETTKFTNICLNENLCLLPTTKLLQRYCSCMLSPTTVLSKILSNRNMFVQFEDEQLMMLAEQSKMRYERKQNLPLDGIFISFYGGDNLDSKREVLTEKGCIILGEIPIKFCSNYFKKIGSGSFIIGSYNSETSIPSYISSVLVTSHSFLLLGSSIKELSFLLNVIEKAPFSSDTNSKTGTCKIGLLKWDDEIVEDNIRDILENLQDIQIVSIFDNGLNIDSELFSNFDVVIAPINSCSFSVDNALLVATPRTFDLQVLGPFKAESKVLFLANELENRNL